MIFVVDEAARALRCTTGAIAKHLKQLNQDGLVSTKRVGYGGHANGHGWCSPLVVHDDHRNRSVWLQRSYYMLKSKEVKP